MGAAAEVTCFARGYYSIARFGGAVYKQGVLLKYMTHMIKVRSLPAVLLAAIAFLFCSTPASAQAIPKQPVRVLYVEGTTDYWGNAVDPARGADFREFLENNFASVKVCKDVDFSPEITKGSDVIVVDGGLSDRLPADFDRAMVLLGRDFLPLRIAETRGYKLGNL
jgi:hypothetical protein